MPQRRRSDETGVGERRREDDQDMRMMGVVWQAMLLMLLQMPGQRGSV
jgi:hypothetical protein